MKAMKSLMVALKPEHMGAFVKEAKKLSLPTSSFIRMILIQWLSDTGKLDNIESQPITMQVSETPPQEQERI